MESIDKTSPGSWVYVSSGAGVLPKVGIHPDPPAPPPMLDEQKEEPDRVVMLRTRSRINRAIRASRGSKASKSALAHFRKSAGKDAVYQFDLGGAEGLEPVHAFMSFMFQSSVTSTAGSIYNGVLSTDPSGLVDWTSVAAAFQRYRIRKVTVAYQPNNKYSKAVICSPGYLISDYENATALGSRTSAVSYVDNVTFCSLEDQWQHVMSIPSFYPYDQWYDVSSPASMAWIKFYFDNLSASTSYGYITVKYDIEFLGRS